MGISKVLPNTNGIIGSTAAIKNYYSCKTFPKSQAPKVQLATIMSDMCLKYKVYLALAPIGEKIKVKIGTDISYNDYSGGYYFLKLSNGLVEVFHKKNNFHYNLKVGY